MRRERKRAEEALRESEASYRMLFDSIDEGFCIIEVLFDKNENRSIIGFSKSIQRSSGRQESKTR